METIMHNNIASLSEEDYDLHYLRYPAATSRGKFYLIQGDTVIGRVKMGSAMGMLNGIGMYSFVNIEPDDDATKEFFKDDFSLTAIGAGMIIGLRYDGITGRPIKNFDEEPDDRHKGTEIVDSMEFDFGIAHPRYKNVKGWANEINKPKPRVHKTHGYRRPRCSNKIKKAAI